MAQPEPIIPERPVLDRSARFGVYAGGSILHVLGSEESLEGFALGGGVMAQVAKRFGIAARLLISYEVFNQVSGEDYLSLDLVLTARVGPFGTSEGPNGFFLGPSFSLRAMQGLEDGMGADELYFVPSGGLDIGGHFEGFEVILALRAGVFTPFDDAISVLSVQLMGGYVF